MKAWAQALDAVARDGVGGIALISRSSNRFPSSGLDSTQRSFTCKRRNRGGVNIFSHDAENDSLRLRPENSKSVNC